MYVRLLENLGHRRMALEKLLRHGDGLFGSDSDERKSWIATQQTACTPP